MKLECLFQSPAVFIWFKASRCHSWPTIVCRRLGTIEPSVENRIVSKGWYAGAHGLQSILAERNNPRASRTKQPFVATNHQEIAAKILESDILHAESMYAVHPQQDLIFCTTVSVNIADH